MSSWSRYLTVPALLALACAYAACGGEDRGRPSAQRPAERPLAPDIDYCQAADPLDEEGNPKLEYFSISSFDPPGPSAAARCGTEDRSFACQFNFNYDTAHSPADVSGRPKGEDCIKEIRPGALVDTDPNVGSRVVAQLVNRCGADVSAYHFTATNVGMCLGTNGRRGWGGSQEIGFKFTDMAGVDWPVLDMSAWDGISFWVKQGTRPGIESAIIMLVVDEFAAGQIEVEDPTTGEMVSCVSEDPKIEKNPGADSEKCDPYSSAITLTPEWTFMKVHFSVLSQKGFGKHAPNGLDLTDIIRLQFLITAGDWDFWLDDVSLFRDVE